MEQSQTFIDAVTEMLETMKLQGQTTVRVSKENRLFLRKLYKQGSHANTESQTQAMPVRPPVPTPAKQQAVPPPASPATPPAPSSSAPAVVPPESPAKPPPFVIPPPAQSAKPAPEQVRPAFQPVATIDTSGLDWSELERTAKGCSACGLCNGRTQVVFDTGNRDADLMFIGEGPGQDEDIEGVPFVGKAGQLLTKIIQAMGYAREQVYIANIIKCRPPNNRNPQPDEADACLHFLKRQIQLVNPKVIVLLGAVPLQYLMNVRGIMRSRGTWLEYGSIPVMPTYHPSFLLRKPENKRAVWDDMQQVMARLGSKPPEQA